MNQPRVFPSTFLWGSAVSGHQIEGVNKHSDWWHWELATDGQPESGQAVDYWHRFEEDHALLEEMGHQSFRLGIEWARIEPQCGEFDLHALAHYRLILASLRRHKIKICLTLHHWVLPKWIADQGDWLNPKTVTYFERYARFIIKELGGFPTVWITLNEPMVALLAGNISGDFPPQRRSLRAFRKAARHMLTAHARAYKAIHEHRASARVGIAMAYPYFEASGSKGIAGWYERVAETVTRRLMFRAWDHSIQTGKLDCYLGRGSIAGLKESLDFCGINYYFRITLKASLTHWKTGFIQIDSVPDGTETTDLGWQIYPPGLGQIIREVWARFNKPIFITENGLADAQDEKRAAFIDAHLGEIHAALQQGIPVEGYFHWSFLDNFEWKEGFEPKFGLVAVDLLDPELRRTPRASANHYSQIIKTNTV